MAFITTTDYTALVRDEIKSILLENYDESKISAAEQMAMSQVRSYLSGRYDMALAFGEEAESRNAHLVMIVIDCTLYHLYTSAVAREMPEIRSVRYQDAIDWLKLVNKGEANADLPDLTAEDGSALGDILISSKHKQENHRW